QLLRVGEQRPAGPVHQRLRRARGARGEQHVERVVVGQVGQLGLASRAEVRLPGGEARRRLRVQARVGQRDGGYAAEALAQARGGARGVEALAAVEVADRREERLGRELLEARRRRLRPEVGRGRGEDGAEPRAGQQQGQRLGDVGRERDDVV